MAAFVWRWSIYTRCAVTEAIHKGRNWVEVGTTGDRRVAEAIPQPEVWGLVGGCLG
jgi:hypothetical protein